MKLLNTKSLLKLSSLLLIVNFLFTFFSIYQVIVSIAVTAFLLFFISLSKKLYTKRKQHSRANKLNNQPNSSPFLYYSFDSAKKTITPSPQDFSSKLTDSSTLNKDISNRFASLIFDPKQLPKNFLNYN